MIAKHIDAITQADIQELVDNQVSESRTLEYKLILPGNNDGDKKEFLADVSSFGNASGGDIIFGIQEAVDSVGKKTGTPKCVRPIDGTTSDEANLRLEGMIRTGIDPRLQTNIRVIKGFGEGGQGFVLVLRIPKSLSSPHMVVFQGSSRFFSRNSAGKYPLDVREIRAAFLATDSQADKIRRFRENRLGKVVADETPILLLSKSRLVIHIVPIAPFLNENRYDLSNLHALQLAFPPIMGSNFTIRRNLDGVVTWIRSERPTESLSYCQLFLNGAVESVCSGEVFTGASEHDEKVIYTDYEVHIVEAIERYMKGLKSLGVDSPITIGLTILDCKGACFPPPLNARGVRSVLDGRRNKPLLTIDRDSIVLPEIIIENANANVPSVMRPVFDMVWNAGGHPMSRNYDENGMWKPLV